MHIKKVIETGLKNKNIRFIVFRYFIYAVQFGNTIFIAKNLGSYFMGELGFITLVIQYLTQINFGIPYALNVKLAMLEGKDAALQSKYAGNSLLFTAIQSAIIFALVGVAAFTHIPVFLKYDFYSFIYLVAFNAVLQNFDILFINIFRIKNSLKAITLYQAMMPLTNLAACFLWKGKELLYALIISQIFCYLLSLIVFIIYSPVQLKLSIKMPVQKDLLKTGLSLLLYNAGFYFIMIITRTFVSYFFSVKDLGNFSFALSFAQASFLALDTISFLILPKLINRFKYRQGDALFAKIYYVRNNYNLVAFLLIFCTILVFPLILHFLPGYKNSFKSFTLISISLAMLSGNFGISALFISGGKEFLLGKIALLALLVNFVLVWIISTHSSMYYMLCLAPLITYIIYSCFLGYFFNLIYLKTKGIKAFFSNLDWRLVVPALLLLGAIMCNNIFMQVIAYLSVIILNATRIKGLIPILKNLVTNPSVFKI